jgi:hypothetical protein
MRSGLFLLLCSFAVSTVVEARETLGIRVPELRLTDGSVLRDVKLMSYSASQHGVVIAVDRQLRVLPLTHLPHHLQQGVLRDYNEERVRIVPNVVTTTVRPSSAVAPAAPRAGADPAAAPEGSLERLQQQAATEAPDELRFHLQRTNARVSSLDCKIRSVEKVPGWQRIRVSGTASYSVWNHHGRDYVWRTGKFEVEFEIAEGDRLRAANVTFDGISRRVTD